MTPSPFAWLLRLLLVAFVALAPAPATAQTDTWKTLKEKGDEAFRERRYGEALELYDAAWAKEQQPVLNYNRGRAYEALGRFPEALDQFESFVERAPKDLKAKVPKLDALMEETRGKVCTVTIESVPVGATVLLDGVKLGVTPIVDRRVNAGDVELELSADNYLPKTQSVSLPGGGTLPLKVSLAPVTQGKLIVKTDPEGATVTIDGKPAGLSPIVREVTSGEHQLRIELDGYETIEDTFAVEPGKDETVSITLTSTTPVYAAWWFWTSIGGAVAVAGGLTATFVALNTEKDPEPGSIDPGLVQAPITGASILQLAF